ncbi:hypothetical protein GSI_01605 [Ganoderma sinense ZZ0214-1]|uniref:Uncharacterized protein n=1 Tax=Ganoderma sinense ZZ0214-1 TaxID=1077348 RepID=A0A2G8SQ99_9APHY|nr:hypothetical protein GSI_01605 [Ganoderma sinense ZZ0214-1]
MNRRFISSLESYHGEYLIVWDSAHAEARREDYLSSWHPGDGIITVGYPRPTVWVKEEEPAAPTARSFVYSPPEEKVVVAIQDSYLGIYQGRTSTTLKPAAYSARRSSFAIPSRRWSGDSVTLVDGKIGGTSRESNAGSRFWRFDWQAKRAPTLGFRYEGTDLTMDEGHVLSFTDTVDDHGSPFAVLELRGIGDMGCVIVVAKRQVSKWATRHLSLTEKMKVGMHAVERPWMEDCVEDLHESLKRARDEYVPKKWFGTIAV